MAMGAVTIDISAKHITFWNYGHAVTNRGMGSMPLQICKATKRHIKQIPVEPTIEHKTERV